MEDRTSFIAYDFHNPVELETYEASDTLLGRLCTTNAFKRLADIRFLGGIDYLLVRSPNGTHKRYTRHQHSIGVARLALSYADARNLSPEKRLLACAAALLHDVGHGPLSHSLEPVFKDAFGIEHHRATEDVIFGRALGSDIVDALLAFGVSPEETVAVINGQYDPFEGFFSGPINFDTIEGVLRTRQYLKSSAASHTPESIMLSAALRRDNRDRDTVDSFWRYKDEVYKLVVRSPLGVLVDHICQEIASHYIDALSQEDFYSTEKVLFGKVPELRKALTSSSSAEFDNWINSKPIKYKARKFFIHRPGDFFNRDDGHRYRQSKEDRLVPASEPQLYGETIRGADLFDEQGIRS